MHHFQTIKTDDYSIYIGDIFAPLVEKIHRIQPSKIVILLDENTEKYCFPILKKEIHHISFETITIQSGEIHKNLTTCELIWNQLIQMHADRNSLIINLSGGVLLDMGGFAASTFKRGISFINMPTTLLAMVDASVGGKTGVNYLEYKNFIGLFSLPNAVFIYPYFLKTLPKRVLQAGKVEMIKHGLIASSAHLWQVLELLGSDFKMSDYNEIIKESVAIKNNVVLQDPKEKHIRKTLNFGHTAGHAFESFFLHHQPSLLHGEAVAHGIIISLLLSVEKLSFSLSDATQIIHQLLKYFPKIDLKDQDVLQLISTMKHDKKNQNQHILFVLLEKIGQPKIDISISEKELISVFKKYQAL